MKKTLLDLFVSAGATALKLIDATGPAEHDGRGAAFAESGLDAADFETWSTYYVDERGRFLNLRKQLAPSAMIAAQEPAAEAPALASEQPEKATE